MNKRTIILVVITLLVTVLSMPVMASLHGVYQGYNVVKVQVNGREVISDVPAINFKGRTLVPIRFVSEALGADVEWNANTSTASISFSGSNGTSNNSVTESERIAQLEAEIEVLRKSLQSSTHILPNGDRYVGQMKNGVPHGLGTYTWASGDRFVGEYRDGLPNGLGTYVWPNGDKLVGEYINGKSNGLGVYQWANGTIQGGIYVNGIMISTGQPVIPTTTTSTITTNTPDIIESRIDGTFEGWSGDTIFKLENGQIWQQVSFAYTYRYAFRPKVLIYRSGTVYRMRVDGVSTEITVKRLK